MFVPDRLFQLSPSHVSTPGSPARGTVWNDQSEGARARVPAADVAVEPVARRLLAVVAAGDHEVLVDGGRGDEAELPVDIAADARLEVDGAAVAEARRRLTRLRIQGQEPIPAPVKSRGGVVPSPGQ